MEPIPQLSPGDLIQIRYRLTRHIGSPDECIADKWIAAEVIDCEAGSHPLVRLADGQVTEIRGFMPWRYAPGYQPDQRRMAA